MNDARGAKAMAQELCRHRVTAVSFASSQQLLVGVQSGWLLDGAHIKVPRKTFVDVKRRWRTKMDDEEGRRGEGEGEKEKGRKGGKGGKGGRGGRGEGGEGGKRGRGDDKIIGAVQRSR